MAKKKKQTITQTGTSLNYGDPSGQFQKLQAESNALAAKNEELRLIQQQGLPNLNPTQDPYQIKVASGGSSKASPPKAQLTSPEVFTSSDTGRPSGITLPNGNTFLGLSPSDVEKVAKLEAERTRIPEGTNLVGTAQGQVNQAFEAQQLAGQVGEFSELPVSPTGLNSGEALTAGIVGAIPRALSLAVAGAGYGALGGSAVAPGIGTAAGATIGAVGGFVSGMSSSMISNYKSQRTDTVNAQKRVLDEGKQNMKDWATMAAADPANKAYYLAEYNKVSAQINQAYRQMKLDTSRDLAKFETALPDLAEFEAFYSRGGERDVLNLDMQTALLSPVSTEYQMLELAQRRVN